MGWLFAFKVNYTIKCNSKKKMKFIQIHGRIELPHTKHTKEDLYELHSSYHRRALLSTGILQKRIQLSKNCRINRQKCEHGIKRTNAKQKFYECKAGILSTYSAKEVSFAKVILPQRNVSRSDETQVHKGTLKRNMVA